MCSCLKRVFSTICEENIRIEFSKNFVSFISLVKHTESIETPISEGTEQHDVKRRIEGSFPFRRQYGYMYKQNAIELAPFPHCSVRCRIDYENLKLFRRWRLNSNTWWFAEACCTVRDRGIQWTHHRAKHAKKTRMQWKTWDLDCTV